MSPVKGATHTGPHWAGVSRPALLTSTLRPVTAVCVAAAVAAMLAPAHPTGAAVGDLFWLGALGATVTLASANARPITVIALAAVAGIVTSGPMLLVAAAGVGVAVGSGIVGRHRSLLAASAGALGINALVRADSVVLADTLALALAATAVILVLASALICSPPSSRRVALRALGGLAAVCLVIVVGAGLAGLLARGDLEGGVEAARRGLELASGADTEQARTL